MRLRTDLTDLIFRVLFSSIFVGLGFEHIFSDAIIQGLMPDWMGDTKRLFSIGAGVVLLTGAASLLLGYRTQLGAALLGSFVVVVTVVIHLPGLVYSPEGLPPEWSWLWQVFQRSNFVKNLCLFGVCVHLLTHEVGRYSLDAWLERRRAGSPL